MLKITVNSRELWNEQTNEFVTIPTTQLVLEHSLVSISKWEAKHHKPYFPKNNKDVKTQDETMDYIKCMTLTQNVPDEVYLALTAQNLKEIKEYIEDPMTATTISRTEGKAYSTKIITSEVIYSWMINLGIPVEFQKWHINRLLMLIRVCDSSMSNGKKISGKDLAVRNTALNAARRRKMGTKG